MRSSAFFTRALVAIAIASAACHSPATENAAPSAKPSASAAPPASWLDQANDIWQNSGETPANIDLTALDESRDAGKPGDVTLRTAIFTGRFKETGDALPPAVAERVLRTMRLPPGGAPQAILFRLFRDDIAPDAAMGTLVLVTDPASTIDWAKLKPKELAAMLPELARPSHQKTSIALTRSFAHSWRAWATGYHFTWDGSKVDAPAAIAMCEHAAALDMVPGGTFPAEGKRADCAAPKIATTITYSCFYLWETKKEKYDCKVESGSAPAITIH
ncbi:hypothetical protein BH09MYX1_BH09MYX1_33690 [soil metagenome]